MHLSAFLEDGMQEDRHILRNEVEQKEGQGGPRKLTSAQERKVKLAFNNQRNALTLPFTNLRKIVH